MSDTQDLQALEAARCAAISAGDVEALKALLADDYTHVHLTGRLDDRDGHLRAVVASPRQVLRHDLTIRQYGDLAVLTGRQTNRTTAADGTVSDVHAVCQQVAVRHSGAWRFVSVHLTPIRAV